MSRIRSAVQVMASPVHLRRTATVALLVGTWLTAFNQGDVLMSEDWTWAMAVKVLLNYLTPFVVANLGLLSHRTEDMTP